MNGLYETLHVEKNAPPEAIKMAYRHLVKKYHPDLYPGDKLRYKKFQDISLAYEVLSDRERRARYDQEIHVRDTKPSFWKPSKTPKERPFADLFGERPPRPPRKGQDVSYTIRVSFEEASCGGQRRLKLHDGRFVDVSIPSGAKEGQSLRLRHQGKPLPGGRPGDAYVNVSIDAHPFFKREGEDILVDLPITFSEALLGARVQVPTLYGPVALVVPPCSNTGTTLRLKGKGVARMGDQYVRLKVVLPEKPDKKLLEFARSWSKDRAGEDVRSHLHR